jgi:hypothetical protein
MFIEEYPGIVPTALCEQIVAAFEADPARTPSVVDVRGAQSVKSHIRTGMRLKPASKSWQPLLKALGPAFSESMHQYVAKFPGLLHFVQNDALTFMGPLIERVDPGQGFGWHVDNTPATWQRVVAGLLYLRTIDEGGTTEFADQAVNVRPETGKIVLFPPYWTHFHRGVSPVAETKYVMGYFWSYQPQPGID